MSKIVLPTGQTVIFDDEDDGIILSRRWYLNNGYAASDRPRSSIDKRKIYMHRLITGALKGLEVDHINRNRLDNRRINLRVCDHASNSRNVLRRDDQGVTWIPKRGEWVAQITHNYRHICLGYFKSKDAACASYRTAVKLLFGDFSPFEEHHVSKH